VVRIILFALENSLKFEKDVMTFRRGEDFIYAEVNIFSGDF